MINGYTTELWVTFSYGCNILFMYHHCFPDLNTNLVSLSEDIKYFSWCLFPHISVTIFSLSLHFIINIITEWSAALLNGAFRIISRDKFLNTSFYRAFDPNHGQ